MLVLGLGNVVMGDDGVGVHVVRALQAESAPPPGVRIVDGGTAGLALLPLLTGARAAVLVDAAEVAAPAGTVRLLPGDGADGVPGRLSVHQVGCADLLATARLLGALPPVVEIVGVQPARVAVGWRLSPQVRSAVPVAAELVLARVRHRLHRLHRQCSPRVTGC